MKRWMGLGAVLAVMLFTGALGEAAAQDELKCGESLPAMSVSSGDDIGIRSQNGGYSNVVQDVRWSSDGGFMLGVIQRRLRVLCNTSGTPVIVPRQRILAEYSIDSSNRYLAFSTGRDIILSDLRTGEQVEQASAFSTISITFFPTGYYVATGDGNGEVSIWDISDFTWNLVAQSRPTDHDDAVSYLSISPDGRFMIGDLHTKGTFIWDLSTLPMLNDPVKFEGVGQAGENAFSITGDLVISRWVSDPAQRPTILVFRPVEEDGQTVWQEVYTIGGLGEYTDLVEFSPDGTLLASYSRAPEGEPSEIKLWDAATGAPVATLVHPTTNLFYSFDFHPNGGLLAVAGNREVRLWGIEP